MPSLNPFRKDPQPSALRREIDAVIDADDATALVDALRPHKDEVQDLLREWQDAAKRSTDPATRRDLVRRSISVALAAAHELDDRAPLEWLVSGGDEPTRETAEAFSNYAQALLQAERYGEADLWTGAAVQVLEKLKSDNPEILGVASAIFAVMGTARMCDENLDGADKAYRASLENARRSGEDLFVSAALLNLVALADRRQAPESANEEFAEVAALAMDHGHRDVFVKVAIERGLAFLHKGELDPAKSAFDRAIAAHPEWPFAYYQRAWVRFLEGDSGGALDDYRECAKLAPVFYTVQREIRCLEDVAGGDLPIEVYRSYCAVREQVREKPEAVQEAAGRMIERVEGFAPAWFLRAEALHASGHDAEARKALREALRLDPDPDTAAAALYLEWLLARRAGDETGGTEAAERLDTAYREQPAAKLVKRLRAEPDRDHRFRWTWSFDGALMFDEVEPERED